MIWTLMILLSFLSIGMVLTPLFFGRKSPISEAQATPAVLVDQLEEVDRDSARGLISDVEAQGARQEIKRRILVAARRVHETPSQKGGEGCTLLWVAVLAVPIIAFSYYGIKGSPEISSLVFADRQTERQEEKRVVELTDKLLAELVADPEGGASQGWMLLAQTYYRMGRYEEAISAFETVAQREDATSATWSMLAEAMITAEQGVVTPKALIAIERAVALEPSNPAATFYKARAMEQSGDEAGAHDLLLARLALSDGFAPWMEAFVTQANFIGGPLGRRLISLADYAPMAQFATDENVGPTADDVAAASEMSQEDRTDFIRSMVNRLATRLEDEPDDLEGWLRLANAYTVLDEREQAITAYERAQALLMAISPTDPRIQNVEKALSDLME
ncbi:c-type cytochrome biogenesis protein CcmI [Falsihalocynthiibacter arcticus]|uniref:Cytochrome C biogenesis protein CycH n=1 Tax=Falsihalocynthiibacter arcticus TaxID=1579316 RepID=A0A126V545_9RHOB|nr:c-type cytochrome biogenesis protein CcmI [Falsihalocynthiibacter arcticus]AML53393.1 cytochrome C biogenesis protein CycH [Falsihalocynthiibacter arcticus]